MLYNLSQINTQAHPNFGNRKTNPNADITSNGIKVGREATAIKNAKKLEVQEALSLERFEHGVIKAIREFKLKKENEQLASLFKKMFP